MRKTPDIDFCPPPHVHTLNTYTTHTHQGYVQLKNSGEQFSHSSILPERRGITYILFFTLNTLLPREVLSIRTVSSLPACWDCASLKTSFITTVRIQRQCTASPLSEDSERCFWQNVTQELLNIICK